MGALKRVTDGQIGEIVIALSRIRRSWLHRLVDSATGRLALGSFTGHRQPRAKEKQ